MLSFGKFQLFPQQNLGPGGAGGCGGMGMDMDGVRPPALPCCRVALRGRAGRLFGLVRHPGATAVAAARVKRLWWVVVLCTPTAAVTASPLVTARAIHEDIPHT